MRPASTTKIWSACRTVFSWVSAPMASISSFSFYGSTLAVASSRRMGASFIMARAMEMRRTYTLSTVMRPRRK